MKKYEYTQTSPSAIYKRIPQDEDDHMRQLCPYEDEYEYSVKMGIKEALESGVNVRADFFLHVMRKYKGNINPALVFEVLDRGVN